MEKKSISMYVLYDHPKDCPDHYIARRWEIFGHRITATMVSITEDNLETLREDIRKKGFTTKIPRSESDDPVIIESYI